MEMISVILLSTLVWAGENWLPLAGIAWMYVGVLLYTRPVKTEEITLTLPLDPGQAPRDK